MSTIKKNCQCCGAEMTVRLADHKRGWGKFCSKSCKANEQTRRTGISGPTAKQEHRPRPMSSAELSLGGYGDADHESEWGADKW